MAEVTLGVVARTAGVSKGTASKALNRRGDISESTRLRVEEVARRLGYARGRGAASPAGTTTVSVVFDSLDNHYASTILDALVTEAAELDAAVVLSTWHRVRREPVPGGVPWLERAHARGAEAFVFITTPVSAQHVATCRRLGAPLVLVDPAAPTPLGAMSIGATNWRGGVQATEHLLRLGHRRIVFLGSPPASTPGNERLAGYRSALHRAGMPAEGELVVAGSFSPADADRLVGLLTGPDRPTAVFAASDAVALGVVDVARRLGLRVPDDLSLVGFDDSYAAPTASPPLTTVRQPLTDMGALAVRVAVERVRAPRTATPPVEMATRLVERASTAPPP
ncbi:LacI family DNA-binding transcriptional regulator [Agilicoccus flavus]|uniref:LacI family DNA-binding transcriptional regulator n=1 Tax=Agilicoccus flavus TaxID=2775968 RepID=UPI001CF65EE3|nr:LacI family DNA-binding transcriptional regulator [Agilicoccus flavus]